MVWMDSKDEVVVLWGAECLEIPYQLTHFENGDIRVKSHRYYPDFFYRDENVRWFIKRCCYGS
jgi:hypothetical protein